MNLEQLFATFGPDKIHWRVGSTTKGDNPKGMALAYLDARDVENRLDEVCGAANWQCDYPWSDGKKVVCRIGIHLGGDWVWKSNGAGDTDYEGDKGAFSDAFKRAAVKWGIGRYLYDCPNWWEPVIQRGRSYAFTDPAMNSLDKKYKQWIEKFGYQEQKKQRALTVVGENIDTIQSIKEYIQLGNLSAAAEAWFTLDNDVKEALWTAPTKGDGGVFTTQERDIMKSDEFSQSYYGPEASHGE